jgi:outer membrane receptor protein involved in Fe transport
VSGTFVRIIGEEQNTREPLRRVPPTHGTARLGWSVGSYWIEGSSMFATRQTRLAPGDLTDIRIPAGGTPGFVTLHARGGLKITGSTQLTLGLENLTNRVYRMHGSGIDMPGTNVVVGIDWTF